MARLVNLQANDNAEIIDDDSQPTLRVTNLGGGPALTVNSLVVTGTATISTANIATEDAAITTTALSAQTLGLTGAASITGASYHGGIGNFNSLAVGSTASIDGDTYIKGKQYNTGLFTAQSACVNSVASIDGDMYLKGKQYNTGLFTARSMCVNSIASIDGDFYVKGNTAITGTLGVTGAQTNSTRVTINTPILAANATLTGLHLRGASVASGAVMAFTADALVSCTTILFITGGVAGTKAIRIVQADGTFAWIPVLPDAAITGAAI